jgi:CRP/FNR family transcriptional regulator, anaerobic regulatory protein
VDVNRPSIPSIKSALQKQAWSGEADCLHCALRSSVLFFGLEQKDFERIHDPIDQFKLAAGAVLYRAGDAGEYMFTIRSGMIKQVRFLPDGTQRIVRLVRSTDVLGLEALVADTYQHDAVALQPTEVCRFPSKLVRGLGRDNPTLHQELMRRWQRALEEADAGLTELSTGSAKARIARLLLRWGYNPQEGTCELFSREDMGALLGITAETSSRTIAEFRRQGWLIETEPNRFLLDTASLQHIAED